MDNKKLVFALIAIFAFLAVLPLAAEDAPARTAESSEPAQAEDTQEAISAQDETAAANTIRQPFSWENAGDVSHYIIAFEYFDEETESFQPYLEHKTTDEETEACLLYLEPPLPPGRYRYTIRTFNILGNEETELTTTNEIAVRKAYKPVVQHLRYPLTFSSTMYLDDVDNNGIIEAEGHDLLLVKQTDEDFMYTSYQLTTGVRTLTPERVVSHDERNRKIQLQFDMKKLDVGVYTLIARDASGLHSEPNSDSTLTVKFKKLVDLDVEAGYTCPVILHDTTIPEYMESKVWPLSAQGRISLMPIKHNWGYLGLGLRASYTRMAVEKDGYSINGNIGMGHVLFVYQIPMFRRHVMAELHGGVGVTYFNNFQFHFPHNINSEPLNTLSMSFDAGATAQLYINKRLYTELTADYIITVNSDMLLGILSPSIGIGWQF